MRTLRASLIQLFQPAWESRVTHGRIQATVIQLASQLLTKKKTTSGVAYQMLSHGRLHRYILMVHCPDQAFYPDAIRAYLQKQQIQPVQQQSVLFARQEQGLALTQPQTNGENNMLLLAIHLPAATTTNIELIQRHIQSILQGVQHSVQDFQPMQQHLEQMSISLAAEQHIDSALIQWMLDDHYILFGILHAKHNHKDLGICKNKSLLNHIMPSFANDVQNMLDTAEAGIHWLHLPSTFAHLYSSIHVEAIRICWLEDGKPQVAVVIGHFSRGARYINASRLPHLKQRWADLSADHALQQSAFYQREIRTLFDRAPKPLLQAIPVLQWLKPFKAIVDMNSPTQVVTARLNPSIGHIEYLLIAVNNQRFGNNIWATMQQTLEDLHFTLFGHEHYTVGSTHLIFVAVQTTQWPHPESLQHAMRQCVIFWKDQARKVLLQESLPAPLLHDALQELNQLPLRYQDQFPAEQFVRDVLVREQVLEQQQSKVRMHLIHNDDEHMVEIHMLAPTQEPLAMMTEKLNAFALITMEQTLVPFQYHDKKMHISRFVCLAPEQLHSEGLPRLCHGIQDVFNHEADHDPLNALVILCGLGTRDVLALIALRNHLTQLMPDVSAAALSAMMIKQTKVSLCLFRVFEGKHRPSMPEAYLQQAKLKFKEAMLEVQSLKEDTWFHALEALIHASVRCNAWARQQGQALAIKLNPQSLDFAPLPRPYREIFVHGVNMEGVHLRGGFVARGGLRFSDRPSDFRTEVLELMATQVVKNGQIVPTGAKGGFVVRDGEGADFVLAQYRLFIRALLSISDNRVSSGTVAPTGIKIDESDENDSYLVVAADKGTARYSDDANAEALAADFWLGDAFASGGSDGYDHKVYGITARGSWMCAAHHFARFAVDLWQDEVSAVA
ncbi:MAG: NAD-glutamate dehydrogenase, partial [Mariprofundaceae bacterium]|nr:NAD-glutamate dehydrogenase [Mariprofundaceae bacterium]